METDEHRNLPASGRAKRTMEEWIPISSASERLGIDEASIMDWCESGVIPWRLSGADGGDSTLVEWSALRHHSETM